VFKVYSEQKSIENFSVAFSEGDLGKLENKYPTIPTIEVTIPHVLCLLKFYVLLKVHLYLNKKLAVDIINIYSKQ